MAEIVNDISSVFSYDFLCSFIPEYVITLVDSFEYHPWIFAALGSMMVGLSGILPLLIIPIDETANLENGAGAATLRVLLSFAVGGLLGDVFLHLLPEAWQNDLNNRKEGEHVSMKCGLWVLCGMLVFIVVEKLFAGYAEEQEAEKSKQPISSVEANGLIPETLEIEDIHNLVEAEKKKRLRLNSLKDGTILPNCDGEDSKILYESCLFNNNANGVGMCGESLCNGALTNGLSKGRCVMGNRWMGRCLLKEANLATNAKDKNKSNEGKSKHVAGYLNLMANSIDNFTHGLAVGGSFMVSLRVGLLTTFAILVHEIPHEVGDFAILLKSGFTRWEAAKAQLATASAGLMGAMAAVVFSGASNTIEAKTSWILPFTAGGFLHIAMVTVLPDLLKEEDKREALKQIVALISGIAIMATLTAYCG